MSAPVEVRHLTRGHWSHGPPVSEDRNPARPDEIVAVVPDASPAELADAVASARASRADWARTPAPARGEILFRAAALLAERAESIGTELAREEGKTAAEGIGETRRAATILRYFAGQTSEAIGEVYPSAAPGTRIQTLRQPIGTVAIITPWNFPIAIPAWKIAPALAYGNTVVFKPATATPLSAYRLVEALVDAGLPPGVLELAFASGPAVTTAWIESGEVDAISFTGSESVGRDLAARAYQRHMRVQLELGGKNAVIVSDDADVDLAADAIVRGAMASAGQKCTATARVIALESVRQAVLEAILARVGNLKPGDPLDPTVTLGPLIDAQARARVETLTAAAEASGASAFRPIGVPVGPAYLAPIILDGVDPRSSIMQEEVFGPVLGIVSVPDVATAIQVHNGVPFGLAGSIFTRDLATADQFIQSASVGIVHVNGETAGAEPHVPFGGMKGSSSWSREQGHSASEFYTQTKTVYVDGLPEVGLFDGD
jgi:alpha-ketoglutaric semialdehyde dehydrogenase